MAPRLPQEIARYAQTSPACLDASTAGYLNRASCESFGFYLIALDEAEKKVRELMGERLGERHLRVASFVELEEK